MARLPSLLAAALLLLSGCGIHPRPAERGMAVARGRVAAPNPALKGALRVSGVIGGGRRGLFSPHQIQAADVERGLTESLGAAGLLAGSPEAARFAVSAEVLEVDQPFQIEHEQVTTTIRYVLTDLRAGEPIHVRQVEVPYQASSDSAFRTGERSRVAGEGSVRESIETFLDGLAEVKVPGEPAAAPAPDDAG
jgi:hypothetical protein